MKLEKFKKYGIRNKKIICSVIGITIIIGMFILFKSFAFFESKYDFNIIKGRVPEFNVSDVTLAFTIDGVKSSDAFPKQDSRYVAKTITCEKGATASWDSNLWALKKINSNGNTKINCSIDFKTITKFNETKVGDYVEFTPSSTSYIIPKNLTGYNKEQTINPSELNLWRIIRKNEDGTMDMVSEYVSSNNIYFQGKIGYVKYIETLNTIAEQYETEGITIGSRYIGYDRQTLNITDTTMIDKAPSPWTESTNNTNSSKGSIRESQGGGDVGYSTDMTLLRNAIGNLKAFQQGTTSYAKYWIGSRFYTADKVGDVYSSRFSARIIDEQGNMNHKILYYNNNVFFYNIHLNNLRPIVVVGSWLTTISGNGTESSPWKLN